MGDLTWKEIEAVALSLVGEANLEVNPEAYEILEKSVPHKPQPLSQMDAQLQYQNAASMQALAPRPVPTMLSWRGPRGQINIRRRPSDKERIAALERRIQELEGKR